MTLLIGNEGEVLHTGNSEWKIALLLREDGCARGRQGIAWRCSIDTDQLPLLVGAVPIEILHDPRTVHGRGALDLDSLVAVMVEKPNIAGIRVQQTELLIRTVGIGSLYDRGAVRRRPVINIENLA